MLTEDNVRTGFFEEPEYRVLLAEMPENQRPVVRSSTSLGGVWGRFCP